MRLIYQHSGNSVFRRDILRVPLARDVTRRRPPSLYSSFAGYFCLYVDYNRKSSVANTTKGRLGSNPGRLTQYLRPQVRV